jgi:hypothetical protein
LLRLKKRFKNSLGKQKSAQHEEEKEYLMPPLV